MTLPIKSAADQPAQPWVIIIYGPPGSGKTVFAAGAPKPLFLMLDRGGDRSLLNHPSTRDSLVLRCRSFDSAVTAVRGLSGEFKAGLDVETVILDSITEVQEGDRNAQARKGGDLLTDPKWKFNEHIYTVNNFRVSQLLLELFGLGKNVIIISHVKEDLVGPEGNQTVQIRPAISPALLSSTLAKVDGAFYLTATGTNRTLRISRGSNETIKTRFKSAIPAITNPTFADLLPILNGGTES